MNILVINSGSSSLKFKLFSEKLKVLMSGNAERIGLAGGFVDFQVGEKTERIDKDFSNTEIVLSVVLGKIEASGFSLEDIKKIGHRVVHGGEKFFEPIEVNPSVVTELEKLNELAMLHNPPNIAGIKGCLKLLPNAKNYAVFDTAFHQTIPVESYLYPLPLAFYQKYGIRKYGFHGISHEYVARQAAQNLKKDLSKLNLITCHLGSGCSITAIKNGKSIDTSMGLTPLEGLMMSSRCGDIDPAIPLFLIKKGLTPDQVDNAMNKESGFIGVCGFKDLRDVLSASGIKVEGYKSQINFTEEQKKYSKIALDMFIYRVRKYIASYYLALGGKVNAIVFTAGIGERSLPVRAMITKDLPFKTKFLVVPTNEELAIAEKIV